jgi:hypothetical protein
LAYLPGEILRPEAAAGVLDELLAGLPGLETHALFGAEPDTA